MLMLALALIQYWALTLEGHTQQVGACLQRLEMNLSQEIQEFCTTAVGKRRGNPCPKSLLQAHYNFQHVQEIMTKCFADIFRFGRC